jgi:hypothetical protein
VRCQFEPQPHGKAAFDFDIYLFPEYRLGLGFFALWEHANKYMRERGIKSTCSRVSRYNTQSRKSHSHLDCKQVGVAIFLTGPKRQIMLASIAPYIHFSNTPEKRPTIQIRTD